MATVPVNMRWPEELVERVDGYLEGRPENRTELVIAAVGQFIEGGADPKAKLFAPTEREADGEGEGPAAAAIGPAPSLPYRCPRHRCEFQAISSKAVCPDHGKTVVPA